MNSKFPFESNRPWGNFRQFTENESTTVKIINVNPDELLSLQSHKNRSEFWKVLSGSGFAEIGDKKIGLNIGDEINISENEKHRLGAYKDGISILEIAFGKFDENDIERYEDKYGRI